jgi:hypothetical protein
MALVDASHAPTARCYAVACMIAPSIATPVVRGVLLNATPPG